MLDTKDKEAFFRSLLAPFFKFGTRLIARVVIYFIVLRKLRSVSVITMLHIVVQWVEENTVSVVRENLFSKLNKR